MRLNAIASSLLVSFPLTELCSSALSTLILFRASSSLPEYYPHSLPSYVTSRHLVVVAVTVTTKLFGHASTSVGQAPTHAVSKLVMVVVSGHAAIAGGIVTVEKVGRGHWNAQPLPLGEPWEIETS